ncbi:hypothetical protein AVEN_125765-1 [Araneus ventricosus]|uniref:Uncharacterized protein n=1 Tax=Araneus ventricosus TaxID=182803 RepID=A0A4Y2QY78_ARAVE|nr:hypothetical protein AVEN_125765-1 [Araneus ventricosus]
MSPLHNITKSLCVIIAIINLLVYSSIESCESPLILLLFELISQVLLVLTVAQWADAKDLLDAMGYGVVYRGGSALATSKDGILWRNACGCGSSMCGSYGSCRPDYSPKPAPRPQPLPSCRPCEESGNFGNCGCSPSLRPRPAPRPQPPPPCRPCEGSGNFGNCGCSPSLRPRTAPLSPCDCPPAIPDVIIRIDEG